MDSAKSAFNSGTALVAAQYTPMPEPVPTFATPSRDETTHLESGLYTQTLDFADFRYT